MKSYYRIARTALIMVLVSLISQTNPLMGQEETSSLKSKSAEFFDADVKEAKVVMSRFSDEELTALVEEWKQTLSLKDKRRLWLVKELEERRADAVAADRLLYVFLAVFFTVLLILLFVLSIYKNYRRISKELE